MAQEVRGFFDLNRGLMVGDPRQDEARALESSQRAERALRAQMAAQALSMSQRGGGGYTMQGSPNGGGSETARRGHEISNPWNRPDSRPQVSGGFAGGGNLGGNNPNYQPGNYTPGGRVDFSANYNPRPPSQVFDGGVRPEREAILAEIEGGRQRKFAEDQVLAEMAFKQKNAVAQREHEMGLTKMDQTFKQGLADRDARARVMEMRDRTRQESETRRQGLQAGAASTLEPYMERFRQGNFTDDDVKQLLEVAYANPTMGAYIRDNLANPELRRTIESRSNAKMFTGSPEERARRGLQTFTDSPVGFFGDIMKNYLGTYVPGVDTPQEQQSKTMARLQRLLMQLPNRERMGPNAPGGDPFDVNDVSKDPFLRYMLTGR